MNVHVDVGAIEALVAVDIKEHILEAGIAEQGLEFAVRAEAVVKHHRHALRPAVRADRGIGAPVKILEQRGGHVPAWLVQHLDRVQRRFGTVTSRQPAQQFDGKIHVLGTRVPLADILDAAVVEAVLAAGRGVQIDHHPQPGLLRPAKRAIEHLDAALDEGMRRAAVTRVPGIGRAENPVTDGDTHGVDAAFGEPEEILARDPVVPVRTQPCGRCAAQFGTPGGFIGSRKAGEHAGRHPLLEHQPATQVHAAQAISRAGGIHCACCTTGTCGASGTASAPNQRRDRNENACR